MEHETCFLYAELTRSGPTATWNRECVRYSPLSTISEVFGVVAEMIQWSRLVGIRFCSFASGTEEAFTVRLRVFEAGRRGMVRVPYQRNFTLPFSGALQERIRAS